MVMIEPIKLSDIRSGDRIDLAASGDERDAIVDQLALVSLTRFEAHAVLEREGERVTATGRVKAEAAQECVATGQPVSETVDEAFTLVFLPVPHAEAEEEVELGADEMDVIFHDGARIDLGAALIDTLSLSLDPYPRSAEADAAMKEAGILSEEEAGPFGVLAALKDKMQRDS